LKNITGAIRTIKENNILGGACGSLCPTGDLCEKECSATGIGLPIAIGKIQLALIEHAKNTDFQVFSSTERKKGQKVAVVGSGPAGLSCAGELAKAGYPVTVFEAGEEPGGALRYAIMPYRYPPDLLDYEIGDLKTLGVEFQCNAKIEGKGGAQDLLNSGFDAVFLAPGLWSANKLRPDSNGLQGLLSSNAYLGAIRDGRLEEMKSVVENKTVAVIGGGDVAMECAESAIRLGAADVYVVYRRSFLQMPGEEKQRFSALRNGAHFLILNQPVDYQAEGNKLKGLKLVRTCLGDEDESGRRCHEFVSGSEWVFPADVVIEAIGNKPEDESPDWYPGVKTGTDKIIQVDPSTCGTSVEGIFAGGDIIRGADLVVTAVRDGKTAAGSIIQYLSQKEDSRA
jgi:NADPH-dependent glutamate synthase beta subunit-like oxidoreductase